MKSFGAIPVPGRLKITMPSSSTIPFRIGYPKPNAETLAALKDDDLETYDSFDDYLAAMHALVDKDEN